MTKAALVALLLLGGVLSVSAQGPPPAQDGIPIEKLFPGAKVAAKPAGATVEALRKRLQDLLLDRERAIANVNALEGAIQECEYWLSEVQAAEKAKAEAPKVEQKPDPKAKPPKGVKK